VKINSCNIHNITIEKIRNELTEKEVKFNKIVKEYDINIQNDMEKPEKDIENIAFSISIYSYVL